MNLLPARHFAQLWNMSEVSVAVLCKQGRILGAEKQIVNNGRSVAWMIPEDARRPKPGKPGPKKKSRP